ncbi:hypothetical protein Achl_4423 (plasmid) [Pseudarthrobacter chlorophenolicus A6]|uniref:Uncharacterized protein n=1 Tax=Pseudarthrobacter chlorophenolicus (strain ATCC 700700 / DSM 12829 / CIP 107037 / JCM 12360 / KCTC 9906 / NCIMB 13794 / A6) TaxID=452863 RepID=B8HIX7_PSECP|nr:hypothetical protein [Pseudarthrobacter chlorophenolicus]ACL42374.1 hypothetical protein Achl_4423 [Pseudarthrobacter chlorophenolicus A6]SDQ17245.1 hypothetical protein SAMN04489738_0480 [Pseudarthrobacter chlorophenolicus]
MKKSLFARLTGALIVMAALTVGMAPAASAAAAPAHSQVAISTPAAAPAMVSAASTCTGSSTEGKYASSSPQLPVNRWADATANMHSRLDNQFMADTAQLLQRHALVTAGMSSGNFMWSLGTGASAFAINFCMLDSMGGAADQVGATIGGAVLSSGLLAAIVVIAVAILLFQARRRGGAAWKTIVAKGAIVGLLGIMVAGSMNSTGGGKDGSTAEYKPGLMSPGWIVTTLNKTVSSLASAPASALAMPTTQTGIYDTTDPLSCANYIQSLKAGYQSTYGAGADKLSSGVPMIMSTLWEGTGLKTWRSAQFGTNGLDSEAYCHLLDWNSGVGVMGSSLDADRSAAASTVRATMGRYWDKGYNESFYNSKAWQPTDTVSRDRSLVGFATCKLSADGNPTDKGSWSIREPFASGDTEKKVSQDDCKNWFTQEGDAPGAMDWTSNGDDVQKRTQNLDLRDFILTLHGNYNYQGLTSVFAYNLSALAMLLVFGAVAVSIIVAKIAMVIMIITAFFLVIMCLLPSAGTDKLAGFMKMLLGMNIFVFGIQMIFALIAVLSKMLQGLGATFLGGDGSLFATLWTGLSPLLAVYLLHMMFTKVMKVPSPFKLSAGLAWGTSAAAVGGAAAAGVGSLLDRTAGRHGARAMGAAKRAGSRGLNGAMSAASGGRLGKSAVARRGAAAPVGAAAGAAAGARGALAAGSVPGALAGAKRRGGLDMKSAFGAGAAGGAVAAAGKRKGQVSENVEERTSPEAVAEQLQSGEHNTDGRLDHLDLVNTNVANSQLTRGPMSASDRKALKGAQKIERVAATQWEKQRRAELGLAPAPTTMGGKAKAALADTWSSTQQQFREKPLRTSAKVLATGAAVVFTAPALPLAPILAPVAVAGAAFAGKTAARSLAAKAPAAKRAKMDSTTMAYREAMRHQMKQKAPKAPKESKERKGSQQTDAQTSTTVVDQQEMGRSSRNVGPRPDAPPSVGPRSEGQELGRSAPVTEPIPVVSGPRA